MYTAIGIYYSLQKTVCCAGWIGFHLTRTTDSCASSWILFTQLYRHSRSEKH